MKQASELKLLSPPWDYETARLVLKRIACEAYIDRHWETAARLYADANNACGIKSRRAFARSLRASKLPAHRVEWWMQAVDRAQVQHEENMQRGTREVEALRRARPQLLADTRSAIDRLVDEACGVPR